MSKFPKTLQYTLFVVSFLTGGLVFVGLWHKFNSILKVTWISFIAAPLLISIPQTLPTVEPLKNSLIAFVFSLPHGPSGTVPVIEFNHMVSTGMYLGLLLAPVVSVCMVYLVNSLLWRRYRNRIGTLIPILLGGIRNE